MQKQASCSTTSCATTRSTWRRRRFSTAAPSSSPPGPSSTSSSSPGLAPRWIIGGLVPRLHSDDPAVVGFLKRGEPVVLRNCPLVSKLSKQWSFDYLAKNFGAYDKLSVHFAPMNHTAHSRHYGSGLGKGGCTGMTFKRFVDICKREHFEPPSGQPSAHLRYYLQLPVVWNGANDKNGRGAHGLSTESDKAPRAKAPFDQAIDDDVRNLIDWEWLERTQETSGSRPFDTCQLWAGHGGGSTPLHFDSTNNFLSQVRGRKQVLLFSPAQTWNIYPYGVSHPMDNFAMIDVEQPDVERFPAVARARALEAILEPGDVLWLPRFWWHYVHQLDYPSESLSLNFWVGQKGTQSFVERIRTCPLPSDAEVDAAVASAAKDAAYRSSSPAAFETSEAKDEALLAADPTLALHCLHAARMVEAAARSVCNGNVATGNKFLAALALGSEQIWPKDSFGWQRGRKIRGELVGILGPTAANALLRLVSRDGRLHPGLADPVGDDALNSEKGAQTPDAEVEAWMAGKPTEEIARLAKGRVLHGPSEG